MTWLRMDDGMLDHPKWRRALRLGGDEVLAIWFRLVSWCSRNLTDGRVPADVVAQVAEVRSVDRSKAIRALVDANLIAFSHPTDSELTAVSPESDVIVTDYLERNPSREEVLSERRRKSQSQRLRRHTETEAGPHETSEAERGEVPSPSHPLPIPSHPKDPPVEPPAIAPSHPEPSTQPRPVDSDPPSVPGLRRVGGRFAPTDFKPTEQHAVRCQELKLPIEPLLIAFRLQEFNRDYSDWDRRFSKWIEAEKIKLETEKAKASSATRKHGSAQPNAGKTGWEHLEGKS